MLLLVVCAQLLLACDAEEFVFGKYFTKEDGDVSQESSTYYLFTPSKEASSESGKYPVVVEFHGGGFTGGSATKVCSSQCQALLDNGIAFVSFDYRLVSTKYFYCEDGSTVCASPKVLV